MNYTSVRNLCNGTTGVSDFESKYAHEDWRVLTYNLVLSVRLLLLHDLRSLNSWRLLSVGNTNAHFKGKMAAHSVILVWVVS